MQSAHLDFNYYCGKDLECYPNRQNTMCKAQLVSTFGNIFDFIKWVVLLFLFRCEQKFSSNCKNAKYIPITNQMKQLFLDIHNKLRNDQALGKTGHIFTKTASDMATLVSTAIFMRTPFKFILCSVNRAFWYIFHYLNSNVVMGWWTWINVTT